MDGLTRAGVIAKITMPLSLPALASVALYVFMIAWNEFLFAFMFLDNIDIFTLSRGVVSLNSSEVPRQHLMAGAVIATVPRPRPVPVVRTLPRLGPDGWQREGLSR